MDRTVQQGSCQATMAWSLVQPPLAEPVEAPTLLSEEAEACQEVWERVESVYVPAVVEAPVAPSYTLYSFMVS